MAYPVWVLLDHRYKPNWPDLLGYIPGFLNDVDPRPAKEQFGERYISGWNPFRGFELLSLETMSIKYPGDSAMRPLAMTTLHDEKIYLYPHAWVLILDANGSFEISRMD